MPAPSSWLDDAEQSAWRSFLRGTALVNELLDRDLQRYGVSLSEYEVISMVSESPGRHLRMSVLADIVVQSRSRLTHTASRLEKRGWVERRPAEHDGRGVDLWITPEGLAAVDRLAPIHVASVRRTLIEPLTREEFLTLGESMAQVRRSLLGTDTDQS